MSSRTLGLAIRARRELLQLSQEKVADKCQMSRAHLTRIEGGKAAPRWDTIERIAKALNTTTQSLLAA